MVNKSTQTSLRLFVRGNQNENILPYLDWIDEEEGNEIRMDT